MWPPEEWKRTTDSREKKFFDIIAVHSHLKPWRAMFPQFCTLDAVKQNWSQTKRCSTGNMQTLMNFESQPWGIRGSRQKVTSDVVVLSRNGCTSSVREILFNVLQKRHHISEKRKRKTSFQLVCNEGQYVKCITLHCMYCTVNHRKMHLEHQFNRPFLMRLSNPIQLS